MKSEKILVVDDERMIVNLCKKVLTDQGYDVLTASSGEEALKLASSVRFRMAITDLLMPEMDGMETFLALKEKQPDLISVLITGHGTIDTAIQAMGHGFSGFIRKPFAPLELIQVVRDSFLKAALAEENARLKTLIPLYSLGERFISSRSRKEVFDGLIETICHQTGVQKVSVMLYDEAEGCLRIAAATGIASSSPSFSAALAESSPAKLPHGTTSGIIENASPAFLIAALSHLSLPILKRPQLAA